MNRAVFIDRDNTINRDVPYCRRPGDFELLPGVPEGIRLLNDTRFKAVVVTNQSGVARGYFTEKTLADIHREMRRQLAERGVVIDAIYYCPHHPGEGCDCRKPGTAMLRRAAAELRLDLGSSFVIGDSWRDIAMGRSAGCRTVLVGSDENQDFLSPGQRPDHAAGDFYEAAQWVVRHKNLAQDRRRLVESSRQLIMI